MSNLSIHHSRMGGESDGGGEGGDGGKQQAGCACSLKKKPQQAL